MQLISLNVSAIQAVFHRGRLVETGIFKRPVLDRRRLTRMRIEGDQQADLRHHGGVDKAVYCYPQEHYAYWKKELSRDDLSPGAFGENLTVTGLDETEVCIGDVFRIGDAVVQVSQPRTPCFKLGIRLELPAIVELFLRSGRVGFYVRVLEEGNLAAGDPITDIGCGIGRLTVRDAWHLMHFDQANLEAAARAAQLPGLADDWKQTFGQRAGAVDRKHHIE